MTTEVLPQVAHLKFADPLNPQPHNPATCLYCRNARHADQEPDHLHKYDTEVGVAAFNEDSGTRCLMIQCACGHTMEIPGAILTLAETMSRVMPSVPEVRHTPRMSAGGSLAFQTPEYCGFIFRCFYPNPITEGEATIELLTAAMKLQKRFKYPSYRIWNIYADYQQWIDRYLAEPI